MKTPTTMPFPHGDEAPWAWRLPCHEATTLNAEPVPRWLRVEAGQVWATRANATSGAEQAADIWLAPGESLALPAGSEWVLEAWPQARLSVLMAAPPALRCAPRTVFSRGGLLPARPWLKAASWRPAWLRALAA